MNIQRQIVIVEDNAMYREILVQHFKLNPDYDVISYDNAEACLKGLNFNPSAFLLDQELSDPGNEGMTGLQLLLTLRKKGLFAPALFLTEHKAVQPAAEILKGGAFGYMRKEYTDLNQVSEKIRQMLEWHQLQSRIRDLKEVGRKFHRRMVIGICLVLVLLMAIWLLPI